MQLYITKSGTAFKVSTYEANALVLPTIIDHPRYKMGLRMASLLLRHNGMDYALTELKALNRIPYHKMNSFERGVYSECEHYRWCTENNREYFTLSR